MPGYPCCCDEGQTCECEHCQDGVAPCCLAVTITGLANDICDGCGNLNTTFYLRYRGNCVWSNSTCRTQSVAPCGFDQISATLFEDGGSYFLNVTLSDSGSGDGISWTKDLGTDPPECTAWSDVALDLDSAECCNAASATCKVSRSSYCPESATCRKRCDVCENNEVASVYQVVIPDYYGDPYKGSFIVPMGFTGGCGNSCEGRIDMGLIYWDQQCIDQGAHYYLVVWFVGLGFGGNHVRVFFTHSCGSSQHWSMPYFLLETTETLDCAIFDDDIPNNDWPSDPPAHLTAL